jgi:hypothetical protein
MVLFGKRGNQAGSKRPVSTALKSQCRRASFFRSSKFRRTVLSTWLRSVSQRNSYHQNSRLYLELQFCPYWPHRGWVVFLPLARGATGVFSSVLPTAPRVGRFSPSSPRGYRSFLHSRGAGVYHHCYPMTGSSPAGLLCTMIPDDSGCRLQTCRGWESQQFNFAFKLASY